MRTPARPQSHLRYPVTRLFGDTANVRLLRALVEHGDAQNASQLSRTTGLTVAGIHKALNALEAQGVVEALGSGRALVYRVVDTHDLVKALQVIFDQERARWDSLQQALNKVLKREDRVAAAWIYGSVARGDDEPGSDLDLVLLVDQRGIAERVRAALHSLEPKFGIHFSVVDLTRRDLLTTQPSWWTNVCKDGWTLKGLSPSEVMAKLHRDSAA